MIESVILQIAGFNFKVNLHPSDNHFLRQSFVDDVKKYFKGFIKTKADGKTDFTIDMREAQNIEMIYRKKEKTYYAEYMRFKNRTTISALYRMGFLMFSFLLKHILLGVLERKNAFMLHTSSALIGGRAHLFMAHSGGGKSTTMKLVSRRYQSLGDDSAIIRKEGRKYYYYQTPMVEKEWWIGKTSKKYEIGGLYFINKSKTFEVRSLEGQKEVLVKIMDQLLISDQEANNRNTIKLLLGFIRNYSGFHSLHLAKNDEKLLKYFHDKYGEK